MMGAALVIRALSVVTKEYSVNAVLHLKVLIKGRVHTEYARISSCH